jgi:hypothetical protein
MYYGPFCPAAEPPPPPFPQSICHFRFSLFLYLYHTFHIFFLTSYFNLGFLKSPLFNIKTKGVNLSAGVAEAAAAGTKFDLARYLDNVL